MCVYRKHFNAKKDDWKEHLEKLELTLNKLEYIVLKCNTKKYSFVQTKMEYLGIWNLKNALGVLTKL